MSVAPEPECDEFPDVDELVGMLRRTHSQLLRCRETCSDGAVASFAFRQTLNDAGALLKEVDRAMEGFSR